MGQDHLCHPADVGSFRARLLAPGGHVWQGPGLCTCAPHPGRPDAELQQTHSWVKVGTVVHAAPRRTQCADGKKWDIVKTYRDICLK